MYIFMLLLRYFFHHELLGEPYRDVGDSALGSNAENICEYDLQLFQKSVVAVHGFTTPDKRNVIKVIYFEQTFAYSVIRKLFRESDGRLCRKIANILVISRFRKHVKCKLD